MQVMRIYKVFEFASGGSVMLRHMQSNLVKEELVQKDFDFIEDVFLGYIIDKYSVKRIDDVVDPRNINRHIDYYELDDKFGYYRSQYYEKVFCIEMIKCKNWNFTLFNTDMKLMKDRLRKAGYIITGHSYTSANKKSKCYVDIYKPMFAIRKRVVK